MVTHGIARALSEGQVEPQGEYEAQSILLTGGAGFIASHVAIRLTQRYPQAKVGHLALPAPQRSVAKDSLGRRVLKVITFLRIGPAMWSAYHRSDLFRYATMLQRGGACKFDSQGLVLDIL